MPSPELAWTRLSLERSQTDDHQMRRPNMLSVCDREDGPATKAACLYVHTQFTQSHATRYSSGPAVGAHIAAKYGKSAAT
jgi:hypothetical protein